VTDVIILLTFVISSDDMYRQIILRTVICPITLIITVDWDLDLIRTVYPSSPLVYWKIIIHFIIFLGVYLYIFVRFAMSSFIAFFSIICQNY